MTANKLWLWISTFVTIGCFAAATILCPTYWYIYLALMLWSIGMGLSWKTEMIRELEQLYKVKDY